MGDKLTDQWSLRNGHDMGTQGRGKCSWKHLGHFVEGPTWSFLPIELLLCAELYGGNHGRRNRSQQHLPHLFAFGAPNFSSYILAFA